MRKTTLKEKKDQPNKIGNSRISRAEAVIASLLVCNGAVFLAMAFNYRGVIVAKITSGRFELRIDGREIPKSLPGALPPGRSNAEQSQDLLEEEAANYCC
jgi:hypothetical protein